MTADPVLRFADVSLTLGADRIYERLSFAVAEGEFVCMLGPSGFTRVTGVDMWLPIAFAKPCRRWHDIERAVRAWRDHYASCRSRIHTWGLSCRWSAWPTFASAPSKRRRT